MSQEFGVPLHRVDVIGSDDFDRFDVAVVVAGSGADIVAETVDHLMMQRVHAEFSDAQNRREL